jgi:hypothetical protein
MLAEYSRFRFGIAARLALGFVVGLLAAANLVAGEALALVAAAWQQRRSLRSGRALCFPP